MDEAAKAELARRVATRLAVLVALVDESFRPFACASSSIVSRWTSSVMYESPERPLTLLTLM
jgi:hypothetical protein